MTALAAAGGAGSIAGPASQGRPAALVVALGTVVLARWAAWRGGVLDPIAVGVIFGAALLALGAAAGWRPTRWSGAREAVQAIGLGAVVAVVLAMTALVGVHPSWAAAYAAGMPIAPWAVATVMVATAEEVVLRGALFDALARPHGVTVAVVATSAVFALMHVPVYGWQAVPLDFGVGLVLAGLRLVTGGVTAPAIAHALADLAVVWL